MALTTYTTTTKLDQFLSSTGVISYADHDEDGTSDANVLLNCIEDATEEINLYALERYSAADLATSGLVEWWCTQIAVKFLCELRGNPAPHSVELEFERITALLRLIKIGKRDVPGIKLRGVMGPSASNVEVDRRFTEETIVANSRTSLALNVAAVSFTSSSPTASLVGSEVLATNPSNALIVARGVARNPGGYIVSESLELQCCDFTRQIQMPLGRDRVDMTEFVGRENVRCVYTATDNDGNVSEEAVHYISVPYFTKTLTCDPTRPASDTNSKTLLDALVKADGPRDQILVYAGPSGVWSLGLNGENSRYNIVKENFTMAAVAGEEVIIDASSGSSSSWRIRGSTNSTWSGLHFRNTTTEAILLGSVSLQAEFCSLRDIKVTQAEFRGIYCPFASNNAIVDCVVDGVTLSGSSAFGININNGGSDNHVVRCLIQNSARDGILCENDTSGAVIRHNVIKSNGRQGVLVERSLGTSYLIEWNRFIENNASAVQIENGSGNCVIQDNTIQRNNDRLPPADNRPGEAGVWLDETENTLVQRNVISGGATGIRVDTDGSDPASQNNIVRFNKVFQNKANDINTPNGDFDGIVIHGADRTAVYCNTIVDNGAPTTRVSNGLRLKDEITTQTTSLVVLNNIVVGQGNITGSRMSKVEDANGVTDWDHQIYHNSQPLTDPYEVGATSGSFTAYKAAFTGHEVNSIEADPELTAAPEFSPRGGVAKGAAAALTTITSIDRTTGVITCPKPWCFRIGDVVSFWDVTDEPTATVTAVGTNDITVAPSEIPDGAAATQDLSLEKAKDKGAVQVT